MRPRIIALMFVIFGFGMGTGLLLFNTCGQAAPVTIRFSDAKPTGAAISVYVSGAVHVPGVYPLHAGDRVVDAVEAAGGPAADADTEAVNFAQRLQDEQHLHVPKVGDAPTAQDSGGGTGAPIQTVDINRADSGLLRALPGIGAARAQQIVDSRQKLGPFKSTQDLVGRKILSETVYEQVKDLIVVAP
jgi:competence protein ComEA